MNKAVAIILFFSFSKMFSQTISEINKNIGISDSLTNEKEFRIYKWYNTTNGSELFRIFKNDKEEWIAEFYQHYNSVGKKDKPKFTRTERKPKTDSNLFWLYILDCDVEFLPNIEKINYKLKSEAQFVLERGEYEMYHRINRPLDGESYKAIFKDQDHLKNSFEFNNYDSYLKIYPNVDELKAYEKLMNLIRKEFDVL